MNRARIQAQGLDSGWQALMTRLEVLKADDFVNALLKGLDGKEARLIRALWASVEGSDLGLAVVS